MAALPWEEDWSESGVEEKPPWEVDWAVQESPKPKASKTSTKPTGRKNAFGQPIYDPPDGIPGPPPKGGVWADAASGTVKIARPVKTELTDDAVEQPLFRPVDIGAELSRTRDVGGPMRGFRPGQEIVPVEQAFEAGPEFAQRKQRKKAQDRAERREEAERAAQEIKGRRTVETGKPQYAQYPTGPYIYPQTRKLSPGALAAKEVGEDRGALSAAGDIPQAISEEIFKTPLRGAISGAATGVAFGSPLGPLGMAAGGAIGGLVGATAGKKAKEIIGEEYLSAKESLELKKLAKAAGRKLEKGEELTPDESAAAVEYNKPAIEKLREMASALLDEPGEAVQNLAIAFLRDTPAMLGGIGAVKGLKSAYETAKAAGRLRKAAKRGEEVGARFERAEGTRAAVEATKRKLTGTTLNERLKEATFENVVGSVAVGVPLEQSRGREYDAAAGVQDAIFGAFLSIPQVVKWKKGTVLTREEFEEIGKVVRRAGIENHPKISEILPVLQELSGAPGFKGTFELQPGQKFISRRDAEIAYGKAYIDQFPKEITHFEAGGQSGVKPVSRAEVEAGAIQQGEARIFGGGGAKETVEEAAHLAERYLGTLAGADPRWAAVKQKLDKWKTDVRAAAKREGVELPQDQEILAQAYSATSGFAHEYPEAIQRISIPRDILADFQSLVGVARRPQKVETPASFDLTGKAQERPSEPFQMTRDAYYGELQRLSPEAPRRAFSDHEAMVRQAIDDGKPVPAEALKDYPHLDLLKVHREAHSRAKLDEEGNRTFTAEDLAELDRAQKAYDADKKGRNLFESIFLPRSEISSSEGVPNILSSGEITSPPVSGRDIRTVEPSTSKNVPSTISETGIIPAKVAPGETPRKGVSFSKMQELRKYMRKKLKRDLSEEEVRAAYAELGDDPVPVAKKRKGTSIVARQDRTHEIASTREALLEGLEGAETDIVSAKELPDTFDAFGFNFTKVNTRKQGLIRYKDSKGTTHDFDADDMVHINWRKAEEAQALGPSGKPLGFGEGEEAPFSLKPVRGQQDIFGGEVKGKGKADVSQEDMFGGRGAQASKDAIGKGKEDKGLEGTALERAADAERVERDQASLFSLKPVEGAGADPKKPRDLARAKEAWKKQGTDSPYFKRWFGGSKVVDEGGKPLVVYHGTYQSFDAHDLNPPKKLRQGHAWDQLGIFYTDSPEIASRYASGTPAWGSDAPRTGGNILPAYVSLKNPMRVDYNTILGWNEKQIARLKKQALAKGHDGFILARFGGEGFDYVVFSPEQIKSATGNRGTFDPESPNILYSLKPADPQSQPARQPPRKPPTTTAATAATEGPRKRPMVEERVEELRQAQESLNLERSKLDRDVKETWASLTPEAEKIARTWTVEDFANASKRGILDPAEVMAVQARIADLRAKESSALVDLVIAEQSGDKLAKSKAEMHIAAAQLEKVTMLEAGVNNGTAAGRALAVHRKLMDAIGRDEDATSLIKIIRELGVKPKEAAQLYTLFKNDPAAFGNAIRTYFHFGVMDKVIEFWKAGLLSGPGTHAANLFGNAIENMVMNAETFVAGALDQAFQIFAGDRMARQRFISEGVSELVGNAVGFVPAVKKAWDAMEPILRLEGKNLNLDDKFERQLGSISGKKGELIRTPFKLLEVGDEFFKTLGKYADVYKLSRRKALREGKRGRELLNRQGQIIHEFFNDPNLHKEIAQEIAKSGKARTYQEVYGLGEKPFAPFAQIAAGIQSFQQKGPTARIGGNFVFPFKKTPGNIFDRAFERSPIGFAHTTKLANQWAKAQKEADTAYRKWQMAPKEEKQNLKAASDNAQKAADDLRGKTVDQAARAVTGTIVVSGIVMLVLQGFITGSGPEEYKKRQILEETGWKPYALKIGGKYYPLQRFIGSLAPTIGTVADAVEAAMRGDANFGKLAGSAFKNVTDQSYMRGLMEISATVQDPIRYGQNYLGAMAASFVPASALTRSVARGLDDKKRDLTSETFLESIENRLRYNIPILTKTLPQKYTATGDEARQPGSAVHRFLFGYSAISEEKQAEVERALLELPEYEPSVPKRTYRATLFKGEPAKKVRLTEEEYQVLIDARQMAKGIVSDMVTSKGWGDLPIEAKEEMIQETFNKIWTKSRKQVNNMIRVRLSED